MTVVVVTVTSASTFVVAFAAAVVDSFVKISPLRALELPPPRQTK